MLDAGHCPHDEVPEAFNAELLDWLAQQAAAARPRRGPRQPGAESVVLSVCVCLRTCAPVETCLAVNQ